MFFSFRKIKISVAECIDSLIAQESLSVQVQPEQAQRHPHAAGKY